MVKQDLPFIHLCWLGPIPWLSCTCSIMALKIICFMTFLGIKVWLTAPQTLLLVLLIDGHHICLFPVTWDVPIDQDRWQMIGSVSASSSVSSLSTLGQIPSGLMDLCRSKLHSSLLAIPS